MKRMMTGLTIGLAALLLAGTAGATGPVVDSSLKLWLNADDLTLATGARVETWPDASGTGNDATQANTTKQPFFIADYGGGHAAVYFGPVSLAAADNPGMATPLDISSGDYTVFALFSRNEPMTEASRAVQGSVNWLIGPVSGSVRHYAGGAYVSGTAETVMPGRLYTTMAVHDDNGNLPGYGRFYVGGVDRTSAQTANGYPGTVHVGSSGLYADAPAIRGAVAEVLVYDRLLTAVETNQVTAYLMGKAAAMEAGVRTAGANAVIYRPIIGYSAAYSLSYPVSGVTDHRGSSNGDGVGGTVDEIRSAYWLGRSSVAEEHFVVDLGVPTLIERFELFNISHFNGGGGTGDFEIWGANNVQAGANGQDLASPVKLAEGTLTTQSSSGTIVADIHPSLDKRNAYRYLKFQTLTIAQGSFVGLNEFRAIIGARPKGTIIAIR